MLFTAFVKGDGKLVAPPGSADRKLSTNPISFGVPTFDVLEFPLFLDMATSQVAHGKIRERSKKGQALPEEWTTMASGDPVTDATAFVDGAGALLPLGGSVSGYKGFGLSVMGELFASIIGNSPIPEDRTGEMNNTAAFIAISPTRFSSRAIIESNIETLVDHLRDAESPPELSPGIAAHGETSHSRVKWSTCSPRTGAKPGFLFPRQSPPCYPKSPSSRERRPRSRLPSSDRGPTSPRSGTHVGPTSCIRPIRSTRSRRGVAVDPGR